VSYPSESFSSHKSWFSLFFVFSCHELLHAVELPTFKIVPLGHSISYLTKMKKIPAFLLVSCLASSFLAAERMPNILLIVSDDQGYGEFGFTGNEIVQTPVLDRLAAESAFYSHFLVTPACSPTRASLMTGRHHLLNGVWGVGPRGDAHRDEVFIPQFLESGGYQSWWVGKADTGFMMEHTPLSRGFDWFNIIGGGYLQQRPQMITPRGGNWIEGWTVDIMTESIIEKIHEAGDTPWLAFAAYIIPHTPWETSDEYADPYRQQGYSERLSQIFGSITQLDHNIGRLLETLEATGQAEDTIVLFFSDNGPTEDTPAWKNNNYQSAQHSEAWEFRNPLNLVGQKAEVWDHGIRSPLLVRWPGRITPGERTQLAAVEDVLPTLIDLLAIPEDQLPDHLPFTGQSFRNSLEDPNVVCDRPEVFRMALAGPGAHGSLAPQGIITDEAELDYTRLHVTLHQQQYKFHHLPGGEYRLFDMSVDASERHDLSGQYPELTASMAQRARDRWDEIAAQKRTFEMRQLKIDNAERRWLSRWVLHTNRALHFEGQMQSVFDGGVRGFRQPGDRADYRVKVQQALTVTFLAEGDKLDQCAPINLLIDGKPAPVISRSAERIEFGAVNLPAGNLPFSLTVPGDAQVGSAEGVVLRLILSRVAGG
jgi:arylsulfatase A-like enzyme